MTARFKRFLCDLNGHEGVRFEHTNRITIIPSNSARGTRYTCKRCGAKWTEWDK